MHRDYHLSVYSRFSAVVLLTTGWQWQCLGTSSLTWGRIMTCGSWRASPRTDSPADPHAPESERRVPYGARPQSNPPPPTLSASTISCTTYPVTPLSFSFPLKEEEKKKPFTRVKRLRDYVGRDIRRSLSLKATIIAVPDVNAFNQTEKRFAD